MTAAETRRDAAKAYGLLASQRNRKNVVRRSKKDHSPSRPSSAQKSDRASPQVIPKFSITPTFSKGELKSTIVEASDDREEVSDTASRVQVIAHQYSVRMDSCLSGLAL